MPKSSSILLDIMQSPAAAAALMDSYKKLQEERGAGNWSMGVSFDPGDGIERTLVAALGHDNTDEDMVASSLKLYLALWTMRFATEKLLQSLAREAFLDEETLKDLIPDEMQVMDLAGTAPWDVPEA